MVAARGRMLQAFNLGCRRICPGTRRLARTIWQSDKMLPAMRIGAVNYLNSKPLVYGLEALAPDVRVTYDLPSRLADSLAAGRLDVALVPSVEFFRTPGHRIVSDACVACRGPVLSVKLHFRVPPGEVRRVALDEGSRTSAALTQILLAEMYGVRPQWEPLPIGCGLETTDADAVLLIGDRAIADEERGARSEEREPSEFRAKFGTSARRGVDWTGLPFVFAMWIARPDVDVAEVADVLASARDRWRAAVGRKLRRARRRCWAFRRELAMRYLRDNLHFALGREEARRVAAVLRVVRDAWVGAERAWRCAIEREIELR